jgi:hypothetical protein
MAPAPTRVGTPARPSKLAVNYLLRRLLANAAIPSDLTKAQTTPIQVRRSPSGAAVPNLVRSELHSSRSST